MSANSTTLTPVSPTMGKHGSARIALGTKLGVPHEEVILSDPLNYDSMAPAIVPSLTSLCVAALAKNCVSERATVEPPYLPPNDDLGDPYTGLNETVYEQQ